MVAVAISSAAIADPGASPAKPTAEPAVASNIADEPDALDPTEAAPPAAGIGGEADSAPLTIAPSKTPAVPATLPDTYAVMAFQNRSGANAYDWMNAALPFVLGEKLELHRKLRPVYDSLVIDGPAPEWVNAKTVAAFARERGATWVFTGWINRMDNWDLQLGVSLWRVSGDSVRQVGEVVGRDDFKNVHKLTGAALEELCKRAGMPMDHHALASAYRFPTQDHYAFTLFGRGLAWITGTVGWTDLGRAQRNLERAVFIDPKLAEAQRVLGELYSRTGKPRAARARFAWALSVRKDYYAALVAQSAAEYADGNLEHVAEMYETMVHQRPWDLEIRFQRGKVLWELGETDAALIELDRVVTMRPDDVGARRILVLIHATRGQLDDLVGQLEKVSALAPDHVPTKLDLAAAYAATGQNVDAIATYQAILTIDDHQPQALKFLGDLHAKQGDRKTAIGYYQRAIKANPGDPRPYFRLGAAYMADGDDRRAQKIYRRAQRFKKYLGQTYSNLGAISYRMGKLQESLWYLRRAAKLEPRDPTIRYNLALSLSSYKDTATALEQIDEGLAMAPDHADLHYLRGVVLLRHGDAGRARAAFEKALSLAPNHADARHNLAQLDALDRRTTAGEVVRQ